MKIWKAKDVLTYINRMGSVRHFVSHLVIFKKLSLHFEVTINSVGCWGASVGMFLVTLHASMVIAGSIQNVLGE